MTKTELKENTAKITQILQSENFEAGFELLRTINSHELTKNLSKIITNVLEQKYFFKNDFEEGLNTAMSIPFYAIYLLKSESIGSKLFTTISERSDLDDISRKIIDVKLKIAEQQAKHIEDKNYDWLSESKLSEKDWGSDVFESIYMDDNPQVRIAVAKNPHIPLEILSEFANDFSDYTSSRIRKVVASNPNTPKELINELLEDEYRWVREAAVYNSSMSKEEIGLFLQKEEQNAFPTKYYLKHVDTNSVCWCIPQERLIKKFSIKDLIDSAGGLDNDSLIDWFMDYRWEVSIMGLENPHTKLDTGEDIIPTIVGSTYEQEKSNIVKSMLNGELLIEGLLNYDGTGHWCEFYIELAGEFELNSVIANIEGGITTSYSYESNYENGVFEQDHSKQMICPSSPIINVSFFYNDELYEVDIDELCEGLENDGLDPLDENDLATRIKEEWYLID